jgi:hypothetical protein
LTAFVAVGFGETWTRPEHAAAVVAAIQALLPDESVDLVRAALQRIWEWLAQSQPREHAVVVFLHIISRLDDGYRQYATQLILK